MFKPKWEYVSSKYLPKSHVTIYRDDLLKIQMQIVTRRSNHYNSDKAKFFYFIDHDERVFRSEDQLLGELHKKYDRKERRGYNLITHWVKSLQE